MFSPTDEDRTRLELLHEQLDELQHDCTCGPNDACDACGGKPGITEGMYIYSVDYDALELHIRLSDVDAKSKMSRRMKLDPEFAELAVRLNDLLDSPEDVEEAVEAAELLARIRYPTQTEEAPAEEKELIQK